MNDLFYDSADEGGGSSSALSSLINAAASVGTTALLATQAPQAIAPYSYAPATGNAYAAAYQPQPATHISIFWIVILAVVAFFLVREF